MAETGAASAPERILGDYTTGRPGPTVVVTAGIHGNEPAGAHAIGRVMADLAARAVPLRGRLLGVAGNLGGLRCGERYLTRDLNRRWDRQAIERLRTHGASPDDAEDAEQLAILDLVQPVIDAAARPVVFLDLHSTSGEGYPFACMADVLRNRPFAFGYGIPVVLGLEEVIDGSMIGWFCDRGHVGVAVEGGQHDDPRTLDHHEAVVWLTLVTAGALDRADIPQLAALERRLRERTAALPHVLEIRHRHVVAQDDRFVMRPDYANFDPVDREEWVADDRRGPVLAPESGVMMLPRYQSRGDDGYFLARRVSRFWLAISTVLRKLRLDRVVPLLPGVRPHPSLDDHFVADGRVARFLVTEIFHLFGYRHVRALEGAHVFSRRRPDFRPIVRAD